MIENQTPTAIRPPIPLADMTHLETLLLTLIFDAKDEGDSLNFYTLHGPSDTVTLPRVDLAAVLEESVDGTGSTANRYVAAQLDAAPEGEDADPLDDFDLDITGDTWEQILQDIVRRSSTMAEVVVKSATIPDGPLFDAFAATVTVITATTIKRKSLADALDDLKEDKLAVNERTIDAAMSLWVAARDFRYASSEMKPLQRTIHHLLDAWDAVGEERVRGWIIDIAVDAVFAAEEFQSDPDTRHWSFETDIAPCVLEAFDWRPDGPRMCGDDADFLTAVQVGVQRRYPEDPELF